MKGRWSWSWAWGDEGWEGWGKRGGRAVVVSRSVRVRGRVRVRRVGGCIVSFFFFFFFLVCV